MKVKTFIFYSLIIIYVTLLVLIFFKFINVTIDKYSIIILFGIIGISLLPFAEKIKIGSLLEFETLKDQLERVKSNQLLGEVIRDEKGSFYYFDEEGIHLIPNFETVKILMTRKGIINISNKEFKEFKFAEPMDSVISAPLLNWKGHMFLILNNKKFYISSWGIMADLGKTVEDAINVTDEQIKVYKTVR